jgi:hypothetical protein
MKKRTFDIFKLTGMPPDSDVDGQNEVIDNSIQINGSFHVHDLESGDYYLMQTKDYHPVGCDDITLLDPIEDSEIFEALIKLYDDKDTVAEMLA